MIEMSGTHSKPRRKSLRARASRWGKFTALVIVAHWGIHFSWYLYDHLAALIPIPSAKTAASAVSGTPIFSIPTIVAILVIIDLALERARINNE